MKRSSFKRPAYQPAPAAPLRPLERAVVYATGSAEPVVMTKAPTYRSQKLRDSAKGEDCTVRLPGCPGRADMTIWSHYRGSAGGKGLSIKASDRAGAYACTYCDAVYDGQRTRPIGMTKDEVDLAWHEGHIRSLVRMEQKGLL
jgi:hypothetical protein